MPRKRPSVSVAPLIASVAAASSSAIASDPDEAADALTNRLLDAAASLLSEYGLRRWSMDDVADRAGVGRTTLYRQFASRDDLVYAVLAREVHQVFRDVTAVADRYDNLHDKLIEGALVALGAIEGSLVTALLESDPTTFLPFLTTDAGPLLALGRELIVSQALALGADVDRQTAAELAELAARLGVSFILTRATIFPTDDPDAARKSLHRVLGPLLAPLSVPA